MSFGGYPVVYAGVEDGRTILQAWYRLFATGVNFTQAACFRGKFLFVSPGCGQCAWLPVRFLNPSELTVFVLERE